MVKLQSMSEREFGKYKLRLFQEYTQRAGQVWRVATH